MLNCRVCHCMGMIPKCPFCGRKIDNSKRKSRREQARERGFRERIKMNQAAFNNFKKVNAEGSGCTSFDQDVQDTIGDWR